MTSKLLITTCLALCVFILFLSCNSKTDLVKPQQSREIKDNVQKMMDSIAIDITHDGPTAWLKYFENTSEFFMASDGHLVFANNEIATRFIKNELVKQISKIDLRWGDVRIDVLTNKFANVAATWNEDIADFANKKTSQGGYFTGVAEKTLQGWKLRNAHWSVLKVKSEK